jgi:hypothetical protein
LVHWYFELRRRWFLDSPAVTLTLFFADGSCTRRWAYEKPRRGTRFRTTRGHAGIVDEVVETDVGDYTVHCRAPEPTEGLLSMSSDFALLVFDHARCRIDPRERRLSRFVP